MGTFLENNFFQKLMKSKTKIKSCSLFKKNRDNAREPKFILKIRFLAFSTAPILMVFQGVEVSFDTNSGRACRDLPDLVPLT